MIATAPESDELSQGTSEVPSIDMVMAPTPDEKLVVAGRGQVFKLLPTGKLDPSFGKNGRIEIASEPGTAFRLGGVAVDSLGRVLIAGTSESLTANSTPAPSGFENALGPRPQLAAVYRYLPNGSPDPSFGQDGVVVTTFSLPRPTGPGPYDASYSTAAVGATGIVVDANDNPIVAGFFVRHVGACYTGTPMIYIGQAYVARLTSAGSLDPNFGQSGLVSDPQMEYPATLSRGPGDELAYYGPRSTHCLRGSEPVSSLVKLKGDGSSTRALLPKGA